MSHAYREPAPAHPLDYSVVGDVLELAPESKLPSVCLKCGARRGITRRSERFSPPSSWLAWVGAALGMAVASALRSAPQLVPYLLVVVAVAAAVLVRAAKASGAVVVVRVPLCAPCERRWSAGVRYRKRIVAAVAVFGAALVFAMVERAAVVARIAGAGLSITLFVAVSLKLRARFLEPVRVSTHRVALRGVAPDALARLRRRLERAALAPLLATSGEHDDANDEPASEDPHGGPR